MNKIMKFENSNIQIIEINNIWYFDLYSVGMALGQVVTAKGNTYPNKTRIDKNVKNAEIKPVLRNAKPYITEEQIYDLMLETRTDKCRTFRKWLTNEVLPTLRKTGKYEIPKAETKHYEYFDKTYNGEPVLTLVDVEHLIKIHTATLNCQLNNCYEEGKDYYHLTGHKLMKYKMENPKTVKTVKALKLVTRCGFTKICKAYGIQVEEPKCFENKAEQLMIDLDDKSPKSEDERILENIEKARNKTITVNVLLDAVDRLLELKKDPEYVNMGKVIYEHYIQSFKTVLGYFNIDIK